MADEQKPSDGTGYVPSNSTVATAFGGAVATVVIAVLGQYKIFFPAGVESAIAVIVATVVGYLPKSGRR